MKKHIKYLKYVIRHKWFVLVAGIRIGAPLWRLIIHDWTKFLPSEWFSYVDHFYNPKKTNDRTMEAISRFGVAEAAPWPFFVEDFFNIAWNHHQKRNKHHWQYWVLTEDSGRTFPVAIPEKFIREMVADWAGAGRAINGRWDIRTWYEKNRERINIRSETRVRVEELIGAFEQRVLRDFQATCNIPPSFKAPMC